MTEPTPAVVPLEVRLATIAALLVGITILVSVALTLPLRDAGDVLVIGHIAAYFIWVVGALLLPSSILMLCLLRRPTLWWTATAVIVLSLPVGLALGRRTDDVFDEISWLFSVAWIYDPILVVALGLLDGWMRSHRRVGAAPAGAEPAADHAG